MDGGIVVDASVWVSRFIDQDINHSASYHWIERYATKGGLLIAPAFVLIEVAAAISRRTGNTQLARAVIRDLYLFEATRILSLKDTLMWAGVEVAADLQLRAGDTVYLAVAREYRIPLVSWDKEQLRKEASLTRAYTPNEYPF